MQVSSGSKGCCSRKKIEQGTIDEGGKKFKVGEQEDHDDDVADTPRTSFLAIVFGRINGRTKATAGMSFFLSVSQFPPPLPPPVI